VAVLSNTRYVQEAKGYHSSLTVAPLFTHPE